MGSRDRGGEPPGTATTYVKPFGDALAKLEEQMTETPVQSRSVGVIRLDDMRRPNSGIRREATDHEHAAEQEVEKLVRELRARRRSSNASLRCAGPARFTTPPLADLLEEEVSRPRINQTLAHPASRVAEDPQPDHPRPRLQDARTAAASGTRARDGASDDAPPVRGREAGRAAATAGFKG